MLAVVVSTLLIMVATFVVGLAVAWLIRIVANVLYYFEHHSLLHCITARRRVMHIHYIGKKRAVHKLAKNATSPSNDKKVVHFA